MVGAGPPVTNRFKPPGRSGTRIVEERKSGESEVIIREDKRIGQTYLQFLRDRIY